MGGEKLKTFGMVLSVRRVTFFKKIAGIEKMRRYKREGVFYSPSTTCGGMLDKAGKKESLEILIINWSVLTWERANEKTYAYIIVS